MANTLNAQVYVPQTYNGKRITYRVPYTMPGELIVANGQANVEFPAATFLHTVEKPFEIWSMVLRASQGVDPDAFVPIAAPAPGIDKFWRVRIRDVSKDQLITKAAQLVATLVDNDDDIWWWTIPYTIERAEGFSIAVDNLLPAAQGNALRAEITFRGYILVVDPPSETR